MHLGAFGEIRITRLQPETTVAWEGERASGTVTIEPSSWGTKVTMTAVAPAGEEQAPVPTGDERPPVPEAAVTAPRRPSLIARLAAWFARDRGGQGVELEPDAPAASEAQTVSDEVLGAALDSLGQAHHRPFSQF